MVASKATVPTSAVGSLSTARETLDGGNADAQVTKLGQQDPIDYPDRCAVDYLDHAHGKHKPMR
jgi:hypothetical protein